MVRALLAGTKTQTRRGAKVESTMGRDSILAPRRGKKYASTFLLPDHASRAAVACCPYGVPGDRLWVRESHCDARGGIAARVLYRADGDAACRWTPSIHMPKALSRITLEITEVRVERLQDISEADAKAEGITPLQVRSFASFGADAAEREAMHRRAAVDPYRALWESINGGGSWDVNPWVWAVSFRRIAP